MPSYNFQPPTPTLNSEHNNAQCYSQPDRANHYACISTIGLNSLLLNFESLVFYEFLFLISCSGTFVAIWHQNSSWLILFGENSWQPEWPEVVGVLVQFSSIDYDNIYADLSYVNGRRETGRFSETADSFSAMGSSWWPGKVTSPARVMQPRSTVPVGGKNFRIDDETLQFFCTCSHIYFCVNTSHINFHSIIFW